MSVKKLTKLSLLTALAIIIFVIELRIPELSPVHGVKLGLANIITVCALYSFSLSETAMIVAVRIFIGAIFSGNMFSILYSASGAFLCLLGMSVLRKAIPPESIWLASMAGAVLHNTGQIITAMIVTGTVAVISYFPVLFVSGCIAGAFTGLCAMEVMKRLRIT